MPDPKTSSPIRSVAVLFTAIATLFTAGCERALFAYVNRGTPPPTSTVVYASDRGLSLDV